MSKTTHTPGPWLIAGGTTVYALNAHGYNRFSAQVQRGYADSKWPIEAEEMEANTRLIAAAPELLDALKDCLAFLERDMPVASSGPERRKASAAIAKATGAAQ